MGKIKIKLLTSIMGAITAGKGDVIEVSEKEAKRYVDSGSAEYVSVKVAFDDPVIVKENITNSPKQKTKGKKPVIELRK